MRDCLDTQHKLHNKRAFALRMEGKKRIGNGKPCKKFNFCLVYLYPFPSLHMLRAYVRGMWLQARIRGGDKKNENQVEFWLIWQI